MAIEPIKGFYVHDEVTNTDGVAKYDYDSLENAPDIDGAFDKLENGQAPVFFNTSAGFYGGGGAIQNANPTNKEIYTSKIPVIPNEVIHISWVHEQSHTMWIAYARFDENGDFINRLTLVNSVDGTTYDADLVIPSGTYYISLTGRTYGDATIDIYRDWEFYSDTNTEIDVLNNRLTSISERTYNLLDITEGWTIYDHTEYSINENTVTVTSTKDNVQFIYKLIDIGDATNITVSVGDLETNTTEDPPIMRRCHVGATNTDFAGRVWFDYVEPNSNRTVNMQDYRYLIVGLNSDAGSLNHEFATGNYTTFHDLMVVEGSIVKPYSAPITAVDYVARGMEKSAGTYAIQSKTVKSIAHRGDDFLAPQCTAPSYIIARKRGFEIAENDIELSSDGEYVMWHDVTLQKLGNIVDINGYSMYMDSNNNVYWVDGSTVYTYENDAYQTSSVALSSLTIVNGNDYTTEDFPLAVLKRMDFGSWKSSQFAGTQILTFEEWVLLCKQLGMELYIDRKIGYTKSIVDELCGILKNLGMLKYATWLGTSVAYIPWIRAHNPEARCAVLEHPSAESITTYSAYANDNFFFDGDARTVTKELVELGHSAGFEVECYYAHENYPNQQTVFEIMRNAINCGITGLTTDHYIVDDAFSYLLDEY